MKEEQYNEGGPSDDSRPLDANGYYGIFASLYTLRP
jgi:hypothetical protein